MYGSPEQDFSEPSSRSYENFPYRVLGGRSREFFTIRSGEFIQKLWFFRGFTRHRDPPVDTV
jgi:hypothetical protein